MHDASDLTGIAIVAVAATLCGMLFVRLKQPAIVGYIIAGVLLGPSGFELVQNREAISLLAELGVILLLYFIGMELSLRSFRQIWRVAVITTAVQISASLGVTFLVAHQLGWPPSYAVLFGFSLALSSTAVAVKILDDIGALRQRSGQVAVGILIAQDLAVAPMLIIVASTAGGGFSPWIVLEVLLSIAVLVTVIVLMSQRQRVDLPFHKIIESKREISALASLAFCFAVATLAGLLGMSPAFGAFLAGLIVGNSGQRQALHENAEPVQAVLLMVFFLSIGLLINLEFLWTHIATVLAVWAFVTVFKTGLNILALRIQGETMQTAFLASLVLAQLGEFTFVLAAAAADARVIDDDVHRMLVSITVLSLITAPLTVDLARRLTHRSLRHADGFGKALRLSYFEELRFTKATSLWFWLVSADALDALEHRIGKASAAAKTRIEERRHLKRALEKVKEAPRSEKSEQTSPKGSPKGSPEGSPEGSLEGTPEKIEEEPTHNTDTSEGQKQPPRRWFGMTGKKGS